MRQYDVCLFDWDGTLADSSAVWLGVVREEFAKHDLQPTDREMMQALGDWHNMLQLGLPAEHLDAFRSSARVAAEQRLPEAPLFPHAREVLERMKGQGKRLAVVTAMHRPIIAAMVQHHELDDMFEVVVSGSDVQALKPDPEGILLALRRLDEQPTDKVVMFGDADRDLLAARGAGIRSALYFPPQHGLLHDFAALEACEPAHVVTDWQTVLDQL